MYDALTPKLGDVTAGDLASTFKPNVFGTRGQGPTRVEKTPNDNVRIVVDKWGVPHITAKRRKDVMYGAGWMIGQGAAPAARARAARSARLTVLDPPGINAFGLVTQLRRFTPSAQADAIVAREERLLERSKKGRRILKDMKAYLRGVNAQYRDADRAYKRFTLTDFIAASGFIGSIFGRGGGDEARRSLFLDALREQARRRAGHGGLERPAQLQRPRGAGVSYRSRRAGPRSRTTAPGSVVLDDGSFQPVQYETGPVAHRRAAEHVERAARRRPPLADRAAAVRGRPAARHLLPRARLRDGHARRRASTLAELRSPAPGRTCSSGATRTSRGA